MAASKATLQRQRSSETVIASGRTHKGQIGQAVRERYGEAVGPAAEVMVTAITDDLEAKTAEMVRCDDAHEAELGDDPEAREARDGASLNLTAKLVECREQLTTICGDAYVAKLGFSGKTPVDPVEVLRLGRTVVENLAALMPPASRIPGYQMNPELWRAPLSELVLKLEGLTGRVATEKREAEATLVAKHQAIAAYDQAFSAAANLVSTLLEIAGKTDLAKRVRPSTRRAGQTAEDAPAEGSTTAEQSWPDREKQA